MPIAGRSRFGDVDLHHIDQFATAAPGTNASYRLAGEATHVDGLSAT